VPAPDDDPRVGPVVALDLSRHRRRAGPLQELQGSRAVFGLTPSKYQSGEINRTGAISRCGDEMMRMMLYERPRACWCIQQDVLLKAWRLKIPGTAG